MRRTGRRGRWFVPSVVAGVLVLGAAAAGFYYYRAAGAGDAPGSEHEESRTAEDGAKAPVPVDVAEVARGPVSSYITSTANLVPENEVKVLAEAEGRVARLEVEEGDVVEGGMLLAALVREDAEIAYNKARLRASNAEMAARRAGLMARQDLISREELDKIEMEHEIAAQELAEARWKLEKTEIRSPFSGRVTRRTITVGQHVRPGDELFVVTDFDPLVALVHLPEKDVLSLEPGREVSITLEADANVTFEGRIRQISPVVDTSTGTVKVTIEAVRPPAEVRPGGFVTVKIVRDRRPDAVLVPRESVVRELHDAHVFIARDGRARKRAVTLGLEEDGFLEAVSGVEPGERVVIAGQGALKDGSPIKVLEKPDAATRS